MSPIVWCDRARLPKPLRILVDRHATIYNPFSMRFLLVIALLAGPIVPILPRPHAKEAEHKQCCRCGCGSRNCPCGCQRPIQRSGSDKEQKPGGAAFCDCGDVPLSLPDAPIATPVVALFAWGGVSAATFRDADVVSFSFRGYWPQGPPPDIPLLSTVVILS